MPQETVSNGARRAMFLAAIIIVFGFFGFVYTTNHIKTLEATQPVVPETALTPGITDQAK